MEQRINLVAVSALQNSGPLQRSCEEFEDARPHLGRELSAGEQQAELVFASQSGLKAENAATRDFPEWLCAAAFRPSYTQGIR